MAIIIIVVLLFSVLEKYKEEIILFWQRTFIPGFVEMTAEMSELKIRMNFIWNKNLPILLILLVVINLYKGFTSEKKKRDTFSDCITFKDFFKKYIKRNDPRRDYPLVASFLVLFNQLYKLFINKGFLYIYGPLFIIIP